MLIHVYTYLKREWSRQDWTRKLSHPTSGHQPILNHVDSKKQGQIKEHKCCFNDYHIYALSTVFILRL